jgi:hypothetical protein
MKRLPADAPNILIVLIDDGLRWLTRLAAKSTRRRCQAG